MHGGPCITWWNKWPRGLREGGKGRPWTSTWMYQPPPPEKPNGLAQIVCTNTEEVVTFMWNIFLGKDMKYAFLDRKTNKQTSNINKTVFFLAQNRTHCYIFFSFSFLWLYETYLHGIKNHSMYVFSTFSRNESWINCSALLFS